MYEEIKEALGTSVLEPTGHGGGGCINEGEIFKTDTGQVFLKRNGKSKARKMFDGEYESLKAIAATNTIKVPTPHVVVDNPAGGAVLVMEYLDMHSLNKQSAALGEQLARLHLNNLEMIKKSKEEESRVGQAELDESLDGRMDEPVVQFGFHLPTCCGYLPQDNTWCHDWIEFYTSKLLDQLSMIEKEYNDREARDLWSHLQLKIPELFRGVDVKPSLLHGDLWSGNAAETSDFPVIFDPASFYGHHEYDLAIAGMFGGFGRKFWDSYHALIPKVPGWNIRHKLYKLFHNLNHWNHFGSGYRSGSLSLMRDLCN